ncbi:MAG: threonylcarbamoyl-AMP synthase [Chloroflexi bacterium GWC2_73_18]|nr:MAG: threonylcarbamoyl-AMP synthase [Chloroflexi bacterium GWC2_73_18]
MTQAHVLAGEDPAAVALAAEAIRRGEAVAFPTETVYGLGANALDPLAVARVFEAKGRPRFDPLIVHLAEPGEIARYAHAADAADPRVARLVERFWPGPLTVVLRKLTLIPGIVTAGLETVALRMPDHPVALALIAAAGVPIAAPSANRFGGLSPTRAEHVVRQLGRRVGIVLDGGPCRVGVESTVVLLAGGRAALLRPGGLPTEAIEEAIGPLEVLPDGPIGELAALSPGRQAVHYAPATPLELRAPDSPVRPTPGERIGLLAANEDGRRTAESVGGPFAAVEVLSATGDPVEAAARLFEALHRLDEAGVGLIVAQPVPERGLGRAVMDRLRRAAAASGA